MGNSPPDNQSLDPKTRIRIAIKRLECKSSIAKEAEDALNALLLFVLDDSEVPERVKVVVKKRYEEFGERRDGLVVEQLAECERLVRDEGGD